MKRKIYVIPLGDTKSMQKVFMSSGKYKRYEVVRCECHAPDTGVKYEAEMYTFYYE